jgi:hypothetical protein
VRSINPKFKQRIQTAFCSEKFYPMIQNVVTARIIIQYLSGVFLQKSAVRRPVCQSRARFFAIAAVAMRRILLDPGPRTARGKTRRRIGKSTA